MTQLVTHLSNKAPAQRGPCTLNLAKRSHALAQPHGLLPSRVLSPVNHSVQQNSKGRCRYSTDRAPKQPARGFYCPSRPPLQEEGLGSKSKAFWSNRLRAPSGSLPGVEGAEILAACLMVAK